MTTLIILYIKQSFNPSPKLYITVRFLCLYIWMDLIFCGYIIFYRMHASGWPKSSFRSFCNIYGKTQTNFLANSVKDKEEYCTLCRHCIPLKDTGRSSWNFKEVKRYCISRIELFCLPWIGFNGFWRFTWVLGNFHLIGKL